MNSIEKNKSHYIINLEDSKQTYFDFADGKIYGVSGKPVKTFNSAAKRILKENANNDFVARYLVEKTSSSPYYSDIPKWDIGMVETIYSLYNGKYCVNTLFAVGKFCETEKYKLDNQGIKILTRALESYNNNSLNLMADDIERAVLIAKYPNLPLVIRKLIININKEVRDIVIEDIEKIVFRMEHEEWSCFDTDLYYITKMLERYINLCNLLHKERTYKNLFLSICLMEKEKRLLNDKLCCDWQPKDKLFYENDDFTIVVPTLATEFQEEAHEQSNCVFRTYYPKVVRHETHIVFVRKKEKPDISYITCEVSNDGEIIQYLARFNSQVRDSKALTFKAEYKKFLAEMFNN